MRYCKHLAGPSLGPPLAVSRQGQALCFDGDGDLLWVTGPVLPQAGVWGAGAFSGLADRSMQAEKAGSPRPAAP